ncbi:uncharacterized protein LOC127251226 isoform X2 [Andrographis paniculata]|uniref:uncharacterized protein LOC127251226 isoform X2 n=1 Tax=Andrographis paniculata TaxID=175694 RepID=UPI0021E99AE5|nr:uncharacterized protein LOC127251226 isoform X2 [Andrographis paniculata]
MNDSSDSSFSFQTKRQQQFKFPLAPRRKRRKNTVEEAVLHVKCLGLPLISPSSGQFCVSLCLEPYKPYTIGRKVNLCDFVFADRRVSKVHCQLLFNSWEKKIYLSDGLLLGCSDSFSRFSNNGTFVNGDRIRGVVELRVGDHVQLVCGKGGACKLDSKIGFSLQKAVFREEVINGSLSQFAESKHNVFRLDCCKAADNTRVLLSKCKDILVNDDPVSYIHKQIVLEPESRIDSSCRNDLKRYNEVSCDNILRSCSSRGPQIGSQNQKRVYPGEVEDVNNCESNSKEKVEVVLEEKKFKGSNAALADGFDTLNQTRSCIVDFGGDNSSGLPLDNLDCSHGKKLLDESFDTCVMPPGKKFYLNRLLYGGQDTEQAANVVSLPELLHPIESINWIFIATFTCDILWFLTYCKIPPQLPVTIACHSSERCWKSEPDKRTSVPYSNFPNLTVVYPPFPEVIAFNKDRRNTGIACHHPKLIVLQREDRLRVVVTSANLVQNQDFPRLTIPNCLSLFTQLSTGETNIDSSCDFAAHLAGFMACLLVDMPSQAHLVLELMKYDFKGAAGYLIASVPGVYSRRSSVVYESKNCLVGHGHKLQSSGARFLSSVEASVVGLSHIYRTSVDSNGQQLKKLALFLGKCEENIDGMSEIVLRRDTYILADRNAVSVHLPNPDVSMGDSVQLGFLPRNVAKWVAPLVDIGLFAFSGYINPKEVLAVALEGSSNNVKLILYAHVGPSFSNISDVTQLDHLYAICTLISSSQRHLGLWRLEEVLGQYKWPEHMKSDFMFGSSSVGCLNAQFLAAFSAAAGKRSAPFSDSQESDPDWGSWTASQEMKNPSMKVVFPSIERVKRNRNGIMASRRILCFSQKTWQRMEKLGILHDAVPYPDDRTGFPMHTKVGRRRFLCPDGSSFGWVYCGSHNFSAAAWGRPLSNPQPNRSTRHNSKATGSRLHISNYELGIIFVVPPPDTNQHSSRSLDDIVLPFVVPPPKYKQGDKPATAQAMREAVAQLSEQERQIADTIEEEGDDDDDDAMEEDEGMENEGGYLQVVGVEEREEEKDYADTLWHQVLG